MKKIAKILVVVGLFLFLAIIPFIWLRKPGYMINGVDTNFPLNPISWFLQRFYVWNPAINGGSDWSSSVSAIFFHGLQAFFYWSGFSIINTEKITLIFWLLLLGFSIYFLFSTIQELYFKVTSSLAVYLARIAVVIFYVFNLYQMDVWKNVKVANLMLLIAGPLILAIFMRLQHKKITFPTANIFLIVIMVVCAGMGLNPAYFLIFFFTLIIWLLWYFFAQKIYARKDRKQQFAYAVGGLLSISIVSSFWIVPLLANMLGITGEKVVSLKDLGAQNWLDGLSKNTDILSVLRLQGAWDWYENGLNNIPYVDFASLYFNNPFFIFYSLCIPLLAFLGFYFYRKHYIAYYFSFLILVGLIFSTGSHPPFGSIYLFLTQYLPFFSFFRSPWYIFTFLTVLGYAVCIGFFVQNIVERYHKKATLLVLVILFGNLIYAYPMILGDIFRPHQVIGTYYVSIPQYVYDASKYLNTLSSNARVLVVPQTSAENYKWGYSGVTPLISLSSNASVIFPTFGQEDIGALAKIGQGIEDELIRGNITAVNKTVGIIGVSHLLNRKDLFDKNALPANVFNPETFPVSSIKHFGEWDVYSVRQDLLQPLFSVPSTHVLVDGDVGTLPELASFSEFPQNSDVTFTSGVKTNDQKQLPVDAYNQNYIVPSCLFCKEYIHESLFLPYVRFLPGSFFYKFISWKEQKEEKTYVDPLAKSQFDLDLADKRLAEVQNFVGRKETDKNLMNYSINGFDINIQKAISSAEEATNRGDDVDTLWLKIFDHLSAHVVYIHTLEADNDLQSGVFEDLDKEILKIEQYKTAIQSHVWYSNDLHIKRLTFNIPTSDTYSLFYLKDNNIVNYYDSDPVSTSIITIDNQVASGSGKEGNDQWIAKGNFALQPGKHRIEVTLPSLKNLAKVDNSKSLTVNAKTTMQIVTIPLTELLPAYTYHLSFSFRDVKGLPPRFAINYDGNTTIQSLTSLSTRKLDSSGEWETYTQVLNPVKKVSNGELVFMVQSDNSDEGSIAEFKDINLVIDNDPILTWFHQGKSVTAIEKPSITYTKISPVEYHVTVANANSPFTLLFNQSYQKGWEMFIDGRKVTTHYLVNGYANAWDIDKKGTFEIKVMYAPQKLFYFSVIIAATIAVLSCIAIIFYKIKKLWKN